jgi:PleD family two-component response regulator
MKTKTTKLGKKIIEADDKGMAFAQPLLMKHRILVADDDSSIRDIFKIILVRAGYDLELKEDANEIFNNNFKIP